MKERLAIAIEKECEKLIARHHLSIGQLKRRQNWYSRRTALTPGKPSSYEPNRWKIHKHFNPFCVRKRADYIAQGLAHKLRAFEYTPRPAVVFDVPKPGGGTRRLTSLTIPDAAVSTLIYRDLLSRNAHLMSSYSFAYRSDRRLHHAVDFIYSAVKGRKRQYLVEYDFSKFFDMINHEYLNRVLNERIRISPRELFVVNQFLVSRIVHIVPARTDYEGAKTKPRQTGVPQGASLSLFLANVACLELDGDLEKLGVKFARYADDTVIVCDDYADANTCARLMLEHEKRAGTPINTLKSQGVALFSEENNVEFKTRKSFSFLGHEISQRGIGLSDRTVKQIKKKCSTKIYRHLLLYPRKSEQIYAGRIDAKRGIDWDLVTCVNELRRYIYGQISEATICSVLNGERQSLEMSNGLMSFYPLIDKPDVFKELDGWLCDAVYRAYQMRRKVIAKEWVGIDHPPALTKEQIRTGSWYEHEIENETRLPSFFRAWQYVRKLFQVFGIGRFPTPKYPS